MTPTDYFQSHIPHRMNLLIAFRTRYSGTRSAHSVDPETYRDLFRCAKDVCFLMTRFFCGELGIYFDETTHQMEEAQKWKSRFGSTRAGLPAIRKDPRYGDLCEMYRAANQAVAHIDEVGVDHTFQTAKDDERMVAVIDWIEQMVALHIYKSAGQDLKVAMNLKNNQVL